MIGSTMFTYERPVRFPEVDAARMVFFARFLEYCHDALEALFGGLPGGYAHLTMVRDIGIPTVRAEIDYTAPLRYGDIAMIEVGVLRLGSRSVTFRHRISRKADGVRCANVSHTVVLSHISRLETVPIPDDVRTLLESFALPPEASP